MTVAADAHVAPVTDSRVTALFLCSLPTVYRHGVRPAARLVKSLTLPAYLRCVLCALHF